MRRTGGMRTARIGLTVAGAVLLLLGLAQLILPRIAASRISSRVGRHGGVRSVSVSAWPAVKLLWGSADSVTVVARDLSLTPAQAAALVWEARDASSVDATARSVRIGPLLLRRATLRKRSRSLQAEGFVTEGDVKSALPPGWDLKLLSSRGGQVTVRASGGLFGVGASVDAVALGREGKLVAHPVGLLLERLQLTLFSDPHVYVDRVAAGRQV